MFPSIRFFVFFLLLLTPLFAQTDPSSVISGNTMVKIDDPGNAPYLLNGKQIGAVAYSFQLGICEQTVQDWVVFLQAVASQPNNKNQADPHGLWNAKMASWITRTGNPDGSFSYKVVPGKENLPITNISLYSALRKCNWHENNCPTLNPGDNSDLITENGAYEFAPDGSVFMSPTAHFYISSYNEWVKAAYYKGNGLNSGFWSYPTQSDIPPENKNSNIQNNKANWNVGFGWWPPAMGLTDVNLFPESSSFYGCLDMAGNVNEWTTTPGNPGQYLVCGGSYSSENSSWGNQNDLTITSIPTGCDPTLESNLIGFRMAEVDDDFIPAINRNDLPNITTQLTPREQEFLLATTMTAGVLTGTDVFFIAGEIFYDCWVGMTWEQIVSTFPTGRITSMAIKLVIFSIEGGLAAIKLQNPSQSSH